MNKIKLIRMVFLTSIFSIGTLVHAEGYSGFLDDYYDLTEKEFDNGGVAKMWLSPRLKAESYTKVILDPVVIFPGPKDDSKNNLALIDKVKVYMDAALNEQIGRELTITDTAGPDTVRMRYAITGVEISNQDRKGYQYIPVAFIFTAGKTAAGKREQKVEIFLEVEMTDSITQEVLGRAVREGLGEPLKNKDAELKEENMDPQLDVWAEDARNLAVIVKGKSAAK